MNRLLAISVSLVFLACHSLPADANEHGNGGNARSAAAPAQRSAPVQQPAPRQNVQQRPNTAYAQRSTGYAPAQSYQRPFQQPKGDDAFQARPSAPQPMFRNQVNTAPTYRTAPAFRTSEPTSWNARFSQNRPSDAAGGVGHNVGWTARFQQPGNLDADVRTNARNRGGLGGDHYVTWHERFAHGLNDGHDHSGDGSSDGNLSVPILAAAAVITWGAFGSHPCPCDAGSKSSTTINNTYGSGAPPAIGPVAAAAAPVAQVAAADSNDTQAPYPADSDLPAYDGEPVVVHNGNAPADEYFGSTHMSVLGIRHSIDNTNQRAVGAGEEKGHNLLHMLLVTEQAFHDWQRRYPQDTWIITNGYEMVDDFAKLDAETPNENPHVAAIHGIDLGNWLDATYAGNQYASK